MARPSRGSAGYDPSFSRDLSPIANGPLSDPALPSDTWRPLPRQISFQPAAVRSLLSEVEDRRLFEPDGLVSRSIRRARVTLQLAQAKQAVRHGVPHRPKLYGVVQPKRDQLQFKRPEFVAICIRRHERREVLHALQKVGKGSGGKRPRRNQWSNVRC